MARTSLPLTVFWLAACAVPDSTEGTAEAAPTARAEIPSVVAAPASDVRTMIVTEAARQSVPAALALAVAKVGSNVATSALGATGAVGTMQIPPALADEFDLDTDDLHEAARNVHAGLACLAALEKRYAGDWRLALSHYRGGPLKLVNGSFAPHSFTRRYVRDVLRWWRRYRHDPLTAAWLREVQGQPRFVAASPSGEGHTLVAVAATPTFEHTEFGGRWRAVTGGHRFR